MGLYILRWELLAPVDFQQEYIHGTELIEILITDIGGCRPTGRFKIPLVHRGHPIRRLRVNIAYAPDPCSGKLKDLQVQVRILRGIERRLIFTSEFILQAPAYADRQIRYIPLQRIYYVDDYLLNYFRRYQMQNYLM